MTRKELILRMVERLPDDVTYDRVMYHLDVMKAVETGIEQADRGEGMDHDEFFAQLLAEECPESESSGRRKPRQTSAKSGSTSPGKRRARPGRS